MAIYTKTSTVEVDDDDNGRSIRFYRTSAGVAVSVGLPALGADDGRLVDFLPLTADRNALIALLIKITRSSLARQGATVKP